MREPFASAKRGSAGGAANDAPQTKLHLGAHGSVRAAPQLALPGSSHKPYTLDPKPFTLSSAGCAANDSPQAKLHLGPHGDVRAAPQFGLRGSSHKP